MIERNQGIHLFLRFKRSYIDQIQIKTYVKIDHIETTRKY